MISNSLPDLNLPNEWIEAQRKNIAPPFFVYDQNLGFRLFSQNSNVCWFIFFQEDSKNIIGSGGQTVHTFAKEYFSKQVAAHGWTVLDSFIKLHLSHSEIDCLNTLDGEKGVVKNLGHYYHRDSNGCLYRGMITPYYPRKHLEMGKIRKRRKTAFRIMDIVRRINEKGVIHRDIKLRNIFLDEKGKPVLADFGFSCKSSSRLAKKFVGTIIILAPEILDFFLTKQVAFTIKADVWATAVCVYQILFQNYPSYLELSKWSHLKLEELSARSDIVIDILKKMKTFSETFKNEDVISQKLKKMFVYSEEERPSLTELLPFNNQKEKVKPLDNQRQIAIIQGGVIISREGRMRPAILL